MQTILSMLKRSKFRNSFRLKDKEEQYIKERGWDVIQKHASDFIKTRLSNPKKDGKQTPWRGHPVFIAQHATATCCRKCLYKWHKIPPNRELTKEEIIYITEVIMQWLKNQLTQKN
ncbi:MAG: DUF4186 domain-containing protein [Candidatus Nanoarchaeia archaeon]